MSIAVPGDGFSEEFRRQFLQNSGIQRMVETYQKQVAESLRPLVVQQDVISKRLAEALQPLTTQLSRQIAESIAPAVNSLQTSLARQVANDLDYSALLKAYQHAVRYDADTAIAAPEVEVENPFDAFTDEDLEKLVDQGLAENPDLVARIESDPDYLKVDEQAKKRMKAAAILVSLFLCLLTYAGLEQDEEWAKAVAVTSGAIGTTWKSAQYVNKRIEAAGNKPKDENDGD